MEKDWKQVFLAGEMYQANLAIGLLEEAGIQAVILNQHDSSYPMIGEVEVFVHQDNEARAFEILKDLKI
jgi:hypothetical protein